MPQRQAPPAEQVSPQPGPAPGQAPPPAKIAAAFPVQIFLRVRSAFGGILWLHQPHLIFFLHSPHSLRFGPPMGGGLRFIRWGFSKKSEKTQKNKAPPGLAFFRFVVPCYFLHSLLFFHNLDIIFKKDIDYG
jgi:hypothetical protein